MHLHEYQAKEFLKRYGVTVMPFVVVDSKETIDKVIDESHLEKGVVKVQVHAGGRGKAGGVKLARTSKELKEAAKNLLGMKVVNQQTGPEGMVAQKVIIDSIVDIKKEYYLSAIIDRKSAQAVLVASPEGGMNIEEIAAVKPDRIIRIPIQIDGTVRSYHWIKLSKFMGWKEDLRPKKFVEGFAKAFVDSDASLLEINPLVETTTGDFIALDAKMTVDDNALFRQKFLAGFYDSSQLPASEAAAHTHELSYVSMGGNIGCMVNGAGLAMATMDIIHYYGGSPANFLDVGGGASEEKVAIGFNIILSDPRVRAILVNIFGGIMNCQTIAKGVIAAASKQKVSIPLIVRLEGTDVDKGKKMLAESGLNIIVADSLASAAEKAVEGAMHVHTRE